MIYVSQMAELKENLFNKLILIYQKKKKIKINPKKKIILEIFLEFFITSKGQKT